jgi:hypothetical protein
MLGRAHCQRITVRSGPTAMTAAGARAGTTVDSSKFSSDILTRNFLDTRWGVEGATQFNAHLVALGS